MHCLSAVLHGLRNYNVAYIIYFICFPAGNHIFISGSEDPSKLDSDIHYLWAQNHTLKEQLNQAARGIHTDAHLSSQTVQ